MSAPGGPQRRRGVRASRARLVHALTEAGLKTQAALAEKIADIEGLDSVPKDVVNRVFRELPVDPTTVERVARALDVEAHTLYKTADEEELPVVDSEAAAKPSMRQGRWLGVAAIAVTVAIAAVVFEAADRESVDDRVERAPAPVAAESGKIPSDLDMGMPTVVVMPFGDDANGAFAEALRNALMTDFQVATPTASVLTHTLDPATVAQRLRTDVVIDGDVKTVGRLSAIRVYMFKGGVRQQVWADSVPTVALTDMRETIARASADAVRFATGLPVGGAVTRHFPLAPVQDDYLEGEHYLDRPSNELNVKRAQTRFEAALRQDANYARAHAGLCQALLEEHWMDSEERALTDASLTCGQALQLNPDDRIVAAAHAHFLRRTGRNDEAIELYEQVIERFPKDAAALAGLASSQLHAYRQSGDRSYLLSAKASAQQSADVDPFVWKPLFALATMEWFDGDVRAAIVASETALSRDENEYVLANLGSFYLCDGELEKALDAYERARGLSPQSYVGDEFLGQAHYFLSNFQRSAELRQRAIDSVATGNPEIHEMWGNLGDSYRQAGVRDKAVAAYIRAAEIAERDYLRGTAPVGDQAARAYYYTMLASLDRSAVPISVLRGIDDDIDRIASELNSASALRRMAQTYLQRGEKTKAHATLERATSSCKGYAKLPDLEPLLADGSLANE